VFVSGNSRLTSEREVPLVLHMMQTESQHSVVISKPMCAECIALLM